MKKCINLLQIVLPGALFNPLWAQMETPRFTHLAREQGLSQVYVRTILQDHQGFMWFGTLDGLNKYDGYRFTIYRKDINGPGGLSSSNIDEIFEDSKNNLWIATSNFDCRRQSREHGIAERVLSKLGYTSDKALNGKE